jgi:hypothetical protein
MARKEFFSSIFKGNVKPGDPLYWEKVKSEALYRYVYLVERNCSCFECKNKTISVYPGKSFQ